MSLHRLGSLTVLLILAMASILPSVSAEQGTVYLDDGETYSRNITMAQGHTMYVKYDSNNTLIFMVVDPHGNIIRYANSTYEGSFVDAPVGGNYTLVWQSTSPSSTSLTYDYNEDVIGLNSPAVQLIILVAVIATAVILFVFLRRRKR